MTDEQMVNGCLQGDPIAQKALYTAYARKMMSICMRYAPDREQAQDILQDGFVKVFQKIDHYRGDGPLGGWIARTMVNTALDQIRRNKPFEHSLDLSEAEHLHATDSQAISAIHSGEVEANETLAATDVNDSDEIHAAKCRASRAPAPTVSHSVRPLSGVRRSPLIVMGSMTAAAMASPARPGHRLAGAAPSSTPNGSHPPSPPERPRRPSAPEALTSLGSRYDARRG